MRATHAAVLVVLLTATGHAGAERVPPRHFDLVNATHDSVTSLAVAPAGSGAFHEVALGRPLRGGTTWTTVELADGGCLRDFRVAFRNGRTLLYRDVDVCRHRRLRLRARDGRSGTRAGDQ